VDDVLTRRLRNTRLTGPRLPAPEDVVTWFGAVQSQDYQPAKWSLGERVAGGTDAAVDAAFDEGRILRTHVLRPTWHFVTPADIGWLLEATAHRVLRLNATMVKQTGLDDVILGRAVELITAALEGGRQRTRADLTGVLADGGIEATGFRMAYILMHAELHGVICSGALAGRQHTYALLAERVPDPVRLPREEAIAELAVRYFTSHGPATVKDLQWWSSLTLGEIATGLELAAPRLERTERDGLTWWSGPTEAAEPEPSPTVHLLQGYDEYVSYGETKPLLAPPGLPVSMGERRIPFNHLVILDGTVGGFWKRTIKKRSALIEAALLTPFDAAAIAALERAAAAHGEFLGVPVTVTTALL
jgi:hypothetical protein